MSVLHTPRKGVVLAELLCVALTQSLHCQETDRPNVQPSAVEGLEEVVVTATKREESLQQIPVSVTAITGQDLIDRGAKNLTEYARSIPNLSFTDLGVGRERIAIRGVDSTIGQTVVGYYFDETPLPDSSSISAEKVAFDPELFDIKRVEVLRGPQGTVFGSGSMGGTVRIIPNAPNATQYELSVRNDLSQTQYADGPAESFSGMMNIPIIDERLSLRVVGWTSWESGVIERQVATPASLAGNIETGAPLVFEGAAKVPPGRVLGGRVSLLLQLNAGLALEGSVFYDDQYYRGFQDITTGPQNPNDALVQNFLFGTEEKNRNHLTINDLKLTADLGFSDLITNVSYARRLLSLQQEGAAALEYVGLAAMFDAAPITEVGRDDAYAVELRLSSKAASQATDRFQWLLGSYFADQKGWTDVSWVVPGFSQAFESVVGSVAGDNLIQYRGLAWIRQAAVFGEVSYEPIERLKVTVGSRWFYYSRTDAQPQTGLFAGTPNIGSPPDPYTAPKVRSLADSAVYKGAVRWQQSQNLMLYALASEGFRGGFGRFALPSACGQQVAQLGGSTAEGAVGPDKLWNYEAGAKTDWLGDRLRINASAYRIDWSNVQQQILLNCGFTLETNLGSVVNTGGEIEIEGRLWSALSGGASIGYVHSALQQDIYGVPGTKGLPLPDVPETTAGAYLEYGFKVAGPWRGTARTDFSYTGSSISTYTAGGPFTPDKGSLALLNGRLAFERAHLEVALFGRNLLNRIGRTALERDVSIDVPDRLRYSVNTPRTIGLSVTYRE